jgi:pentatricopeptide repeat protein
MENIQNLVYQLGSNVSFPNIQRNYCLFDENRTTELVRRGEEALPYIDTFLKSACTEEKVTDALQVLDKMLDNGVKGIDKMYPTISRFNDVTSPNVQVLLAGIYRKTLVPDAFGPLNKMLIRQTLMPNSPYFDPTEEIGGAIMEYLKNQANVNKANTFVR